ncbi:hypothetical protein J2045_004605 [Peteryoungia aggregata LMG 23059]|uniref:Uncharacterized protein n=1 Tax=Peteryoungia aggregata LMG 23059 TaxID=1368425 RepID=A0ABU0GE22_9HYPH|nr:hypothetical protein [Peteryoungia aggregata]MDQ0423553.1 hypothetical protein [Peteryoungia aggregata LMG 23059]
MLRNPCLKLAILFAAHLVQSSQSFALDLPECEPEAGSATLEFTTSFRFINAAFNQPDFLLSLSSSAKSWNDGTETHFAYGVPGTSLEENGALYTRHCLLLDALERLDRAPQSITVTFGPRELELTLIGLQKELDAARAALAANPGHSVVLREPQVIEIDPATDPDWVSIDRAQLVKLSDGRRALRLKLHNNGKTRTQPASLQLAAAEDGCMLASIGEIVHVNVRFRMAGGGLEALVNDPEYGDEQVADIATTTDACGYLSMRFQLATIPSMPPGEALSLNFIFDAVDDQPFWEQFKYVRMSFENDSFWPPHTYIDVH